VATILGLAFLAAFSACDGDGEPAGDARRGGSITVGASAIPPVLDPALASDPVALQAMWLAYTSPVTYRRAEGAEGTELAPGLARRLPEVSDDGLTYSFRLRSGLRYSNGAPVKAGDFERAVSRVRRLRSRHARLYAGIETIEADDRTQMVSVTLRSPDPTFPYVLALPSSAPVPRGTPSKDLSAKPPPGIGPYRIGSVRPGERVVLIRKRRFKLADIPPGHADRIVLTRFGPPGSQAAAITEGTLDLMQEPPPAELLPDMRAKYKDSFREETTASTLALRPDATSMPFDDERVRRAVSEALDPAKLVRLYRGLLEPSCNFLPAAIAGYATLDPCPYGDRDEPPDLIRARELVEEAGAQVAPVSLRADPEAAPPGVTRYVLKTLRKIGLRAAPGGSGAELRLERTAPLVAHPAAFLSPFASPALLAEPSLEDTKEAWAAVDERVVEEALASPFGSERRPAFLSDRLDAANCFRFHKVFGVDLASLCLR
jgi:peptide/nickel transport system substrate-binding protein